MIFLLDDDKYYIIRDDNIRDALISYADYIGIDGKIFRVLAKSEEMSVKELIEYINRFSYNGDYIAEVYEIGKKIY